MFHVPERDRITDHPILATSARDGNNGAFDCDSPVPGWRLAIIASDGSDLSVDKWEHVSVHAYRYDGRQMRTPTWDEMCFAKALFWDDEDEVVQFHPKRSEYVNNHPNTLHLWRPVGVVIPTPPSIFVGVK
jgi:hypothetical protein